MQRSGFLNIFLVFVRLCFPSVEWEDRDDGWDALDAVKNRIWSFAPSILQADNEGFSNEDGYHVLWQFTENS